jgi:serine/threonine protein kinase
MAASLMISKNEATFMAPEKFVNGSYVDHRADIYAFDIILYQLVTGGGCGVSSGYGNAQNASLKLGSLRASPKR